MNNPLLILHNDYKVGLTQLARMTDCRDKELLRHWIQTDTLLDSVKKKLFLSAMFVWGNHPKDNRIFRCYFPKGHPHIYHIMCFVFGISSEVLAIRSGFSFRKMQEILRSETLRPTQLTAISKSARTLEQHLISKNDPRSDLITKALKNKETLQCNLKQ